MSEIVAANHERSGDPESNVGIGWQAGRNLRTEEESRLDALATSSLRVPKCDCQNSSSSNALRESPRGSDLGHGSSRRLPHFSSPETMLWSCSAQQKMPSQHMPRRGLALAVTLFAPATRPR